MITVLFKFNLIKSSRNDDKKSIWNDKKTFLILQKDRFYLSDNFFYQ
jgi:hypothetical protein